MAAANPVTAAILPTSAAAQYNFSRQSFCPECKTVDPELIEDTTSGDVVCTSCGTVLADRIIDFRSEWRTFSEQSTHDPVRVGGPTNPLLRDAGLSTVIAKQSGDSKLASWQNRTALGTSERNLRDAFEEISNLADRINLPQTIRTKAMEIYKNMENVKLRKGRSNRGIIATALYIACREMNVARTIKEISDVTGVNKKEIGRCYKFIVKSLESHHAIINTSDFMARFCNKLEMSPNAEHAAAEVARRATEMGIVAGKSPVSVAAASIYLISQLTRKKSTQRDVSVATGVSESTIRNCYKDLYPFRQQLVPEDFAADESLDKLPEA